MDNSLVEESLNEEYKKIVCYVIDSFNMPINTFIHNLNSIRIYRSLDINLGGYYSCKDNTLVYTDKESYIHELFHASSNVNNRTNGIVIIIDDIIFGTSLNEGITDYLSYYAGNKKSSYPVEMFCAHILNLSYGSDFFQFYFNNDGKSLYKSKKNIYTLVCILDDYYNSMMRIYFILSNLNTSKYYNFKLNFEIENAKTCLFEIFGFLSKLPNMSSNIVKREMSYFNFDDIFILLKVNIDDLFQKEL